jgi:hypothetical protein
MPAFIETLVLIFCSVLVAQCETVINFLSSITLANNRSGLDLLLNTWCEAFPDLQGFYQVKLAYNLIYSRSTAMMLVLTSGDARVAEITVKGEQIVEDSGGSKSF